MNSDQILKEIDFRQAALLCGNSTDLQPLLRLRHLLTPTRLPIHLDPGGGQCAATFVSVTAGRPIGTHGCGEDFLQDLKNKIAFLNQRETQLAEVGEPRLFLATELAGPYNPLPADIFREDELQEYQDVFGQNNDAVPWGVDLLLKRAADDHRGPLVRLIHVSTEALNALWMLSNEGQVAPRVICSVQTGQLEMARGPLAKLLTHFEDPPQIWVRGRWALLDVRAEARHDWWKDSAELSGGEFSHVVQRYGHWNGSLGHPENLPAFAERDPNTSLVKAYSKQPIDLEPAISLHVGSRSIRLLQQKLKPRNDGRIIIVTKRIQEKWQLENLPVQHVKLWEDFGVQAGDCLSRALSVLGSITTQNPHFAIVPVGFEDEGYRLRDFLHQSTSPLQLDVYFCNELDFADLRGWR